MSGNCLLLASLNSDPISSNNASSRTKPDFCSAPTVSCFPFRKIWDLGNMFIQICTEWDNQLCWGLQREALHKLGLCWRISASVLIWFGYISKNYVYVTVPSSRNNSCQFLSLFLSLCRVMTAAVWGRISCSRVRQAFKLKFYSFSTTKPTASQINTNTNLQFQSQLLS